MSEERTEYKGELARVENKVAKAEARPLSVPEVREQVNLIQNVLRDVMIKGTHYDEISGCGKVKARDKNGNIMKDSSGREIERPKPVLLKPGAEKILATFRIGTEIAVEDLGDGYDFRYRVIIRGFSIPTGNTIGYGVGECSTKEKKYAWRRAICKAEYDDTTETRKRIYWKPKKNERGYNIKDEAEPELQVRQDPSDIANTVLKMAKKRAMVDLCLTATACSDIFEQDLEDLEDQGQGEPRAPKYQRPEKKAAAPSNNPPPAPAQEDGGHRYSQDDQPPRIISEAQSRRLFAILTKESGQSMEHVQERVTDIWGYTRLKDIETKDYDKIISWLQSGCDDSILKGGPQ